MENTVGTEPTNNVSTSVLWQRKEEARLVLTPSENLRIFPDAMTETRYPMMLKIMVA